MVNSDKLNTLLFSRIDLFEIVMNSSGKFEQEYLNSCTSTSFVIEFLTFNHNIVSYFHFTDGLLNYVKNIISEIKNEKHQNFASTKLEESKSKLKQLREELSSVLEKSILDYKNIRNIVFEWSKVVQDLSLQMDYDGIAAGAKNMVKSNYVLGGMLSFVSILAKESENKIKKKDTVPDLLMYTKGVNFEAMANFCSNYLIINRELYIDFEKDDAWTLLALQIGNPMERIDVGIVDHQMYVKAGFRGKKKFFYVADPLIVGYQEFSLQEMKSYVKKNSAK